MMRKSRPSQKRRLRRAFPILGFNVLLFALLFLLVEGLSTTVLVVKEMAGTRPLAEQHHTEYDPELGWINRPDVDIPDMYGPGVYLRTNSQRFRNEQEIGASVPAGKTRLIFAGDSFTFGYGVDNRHTWVHRLTELDPRLETVNLGQGGYGVDQAYLWYRRVAQQIDHHVAVLAFITVDFERMQHASYWGYGRPFLVVEDGSLETRSVPVPKRPFYIPWLARHSRSLEKLATARLVRELFRRGPRADRDASPTELDPGDRRALGVAVQIFEELASSTRAEGRELVLLYLPTKGDYTGTASEPWREALRAEADHQGWTLIDLIEPFRRVAPLEVEGLFIPRGAIEHPGGAGHYTEAGNRFVAELVLDALVARGVLTARSPTGRLP